MEQGYRLAYLDPSQVQQPLQLAACDQWREEVAGTKELDAVSARALNTAGHKPRQDQQTET